VNDDERHSDGDDEVGDLDAEHPLDPRVFAIDEMLFQLVDGVLYVLLGGGLHIRLREMLLSFG
jgi:hypothetical protein